MSAGSSYRPDIDGMRAIAVLAVLAYHTFPAFAPGGFAGVDVFFVISGYLITLILLKDLREDSFNVLRFYGRRVRRIFPALILVLAAVIFLGWFTLLESQFQLIGKHIASSAAFCSNFLLRQEAGYFDLQAAQKPLLHLWSLAIEEQFYLVWPLLLYATSKMRIDPVWVLLAMSAVSFGSNAVTLRRDPEAAFYMPFDRAWELSLGGFLAAAKTAWPARFGSPSNRIGSALAFVGLACVLASFLLFGDRQPYPGLRALVPVLGSLLLLWSGPGTAINRLLSHPALVFCGLISFPLYLWHWPLLSLDRMIRAAPTPLVIRVSLLLMSVLLAVLTYRFVERPLRFGKHRTAKGVVLCFLLIMLGLSGWCATRGWIIARSQSRGAAQIDAATGDWDFPGTYLEPFWFESRRFWRTKPGAESGREVMYFGDSHVEQFAPRLSWLAASDPRNYPRVVLTTQGNCPPLPYFKPVHPDSQCDGFFEKATAYSRSPAVVSVVVAAAWDHYLERFEFRYTGPRDPYRDLEDMLRELRQSGKRVYLVLKTPVGPPMDPAALVARHFDLFHWKVDVLFDAKGVSVADLDEPPATKTSLIRKAGARAGAIIIDPVDFLCQAGVCPAAQDNGEPRYHDAFHLRSTFVKEHVTFLDRTLTEAMSAQAMPKKAAH